MAPSRQLLLWSVPSIAVLLGIFWFKKKREYAKSDPGGRERLKTLKEELAEALNAQVEAQKCSPLGKADRSIIKSKPIDIVAKGTNSQRSSPLELTDEEVDLEIEKIIRKKSIGKEKRMSAGFDSHSLVVTSCPKKPSSFVVKQETQSLCSPNKPKMISNDTNEISLNDGNCTKGTNVILNVIQSTEELEAGLSQITSTKSEATTSDMNEESNIADTEELHVDNNVIDQHSDTNDSDNRFSAQSRRISERDSANHSPVDPILASPSMCHFSDNHSEVSLLVSCLQSLQINFESFCYSFCCKLNYMLFKKKIIIAID